MGGQNGDRGGGQNADRVSGQSTVGPRFSAGPRPKGMGRRVATVDLCES